jgi:hypothetical protein
MDYIVELYPRYAYLGDIAVGQTHSFIIDLHPTLFALALVARCVRYNRPKNSIEKRTTYPFK